MFERLTVLAVLGTFLSPAAAEASHHKRLTSLSVARGRLAITRYEARAKGRVGPCEAIDSLRVACEVADEIEWVAIAVLHPRSQRISVSWPLWTDSHPYSERAV